MLLSPCQSGFRPGLSTLTQLTHSQLLINDNINQLRCVDGVYTDLSKAFDTISHKKNFYLNCRPMAYKGHC